MEEEKGREKADRAREEGERTQGSEKEGREEGRFNAAMISSRSTKWRASRGPLDNGPSATCSRVLTRPILR